MSEFTTTREELFQNLVLNVPHGYVVTEGEYGPGRSYYLLVGDLLDAFWAFCDHKESLESRSGAVTGAA